MSLKKTHIHACKISSCTQMTREDKELRRTATCTSATTDCERFLLGDKVPELHQCFRCPVHAVPVMRLRQLFCPKVFTCKSSQSFFPFTGTALPALSWTPPAHGEAAAPCNGSLGLRAASCLKGMVKGTGHLCHGVMVGQCQCLVVRFRWGLIRMGTLLDLLPWFLRC